MPTSTVAKSKPRRQRKKRGIKPTAQVKGYQLNMMRKQLKRLIPRPEWKSIDVTQAATVITNTPTVTNISPIAVGTGESGRIGDKVTLRSWIFRIGVTPNSTAGVNFLRVLLVRDKQGNNAAPASTDILQSASNYNSPLNNDNGQRFKILFDRTYTVDTDANGAQVDKMYRKFKTLAEFGATTIATTNSLYLLQVSDQVTNGPSVEWYSRVRYTDS